MTIVLKNSRSWAFSDYFGCHSILNQGSTAANCKNDKLEIMGLVIRASPEILLLHLILCLVLIQFMGQSDLIEKNDWEENGLKHLFENKS